MRILIKVVVMVLKITIKIIAYSIFKISIKGGENIPRKGGALIVCNHVSYLDTFVVNAAIKRVVGFVTIQKVYMHPLLHWFFKRIHIIPIQPGKGKASLEAFNRACQEAINKGEIVCIFSEGQISRNGHLLGFKKGVEYIASGIDAPVIPVHIDGLIGTPLSYDNLRNETINFSWKRLRSSIRVNIGQPIYDGNAFEIWQAMKELESVNFEQRCEQRPGLLQRVKKGRGDNMLNGDAKLNYYRAKNLGLMHEGLVAVICDNEKIGVQLNWELIDLRFVILNLSMAELKGLQIVPQYIVSDIKLDLNQFAKIECLPKPTWEADTSKKNLAAFSDEGFLIKYSEKQFVAYWESISQLFMFKDGFKIYSNIPLNTPLGYLIKIWLPQIYKTELLDENNINEAELLIFNNTIELNSYDLLLMKDLKAISLLDNHTIDLKNKVKPDVKVFNGLSLSKQLPIIAINSPDYIGKGIDGRPLEQLGTKSLSFGRFLPGLSGRILGTDGLEKGANELGVLHVKGPHLPEDTWHNTQVEALIDEEGFLRTNNV